MSGRPKFMPLYWTDLLGDNKVQAMDTKAFGAYMLLLGTAWQEEPPASLPNDDQVLARYSRMSLPEWQELKAMAISPFKVGQDGRLHQKRLRRVYDEVMVQIRTKADRAKKGADARWQGKHIPPAKRKATCTLQDMTEYAASLSFPPECATWAYDSLEANGWMFGSNPVNDWRAVFRIKAQDWRQRKEQGTLKPYGNNRPNNATRPDRNAGTYNAGKAGEYANK